MSQLRRLWCELAHGALLFDAHVVVFTERDSGGRTWVHWRCLVCGRTWMEAAVDTE